MYVRLSSYTTHASPGRTLVCAVCDTCTYVRTYVLCCTFSAGLSVLLQLKVSSEKEVARLQAHNELEVGELNVQLRELSHQLQQASSSASTHAPLLPTLTAQPSGAATEGKPIAKRTRRKRWVPGG